MDQLPHQQFKTHDKGQQIDKMGVLTPITEERLFSVFVNNKKDVIN